jgi:vacuolar-type H+-ATPase catalytic subunit A/Vma1
MGSTPIISTTNEILSILFATQEPLQKCEGFLYIYNKQNYMPYSREFKEWTNANVESTFSICGTDFIQILPGEINNDVVCDGFGIIGLKKEDDGTLMVKLKSDNPEGFIYKPYYELESENKILF